MAGQGGVSVMDFTDPAHPSEITYFDRGPTDGKMLVGCRKVTITSCYASTGEDPSAGFESSALGFPPTPTTCFLVSWALSNLKGKPQQTSPASRTFRAMQRNHVLEGFASSPKSSIIRLLHGAADCR